MWSEPKMSESPEKQILKETLVNLKAKQLILQQPMRSHQFQQAKHARNPKTRFRNSE